MDNYTINFFLFYRLKKRYFQSWYVWPIMRNIFVSRTVEYFGISQDGRWISSFSVPHKSMLMSSTEDEYIRLSVNFFFRNSSQQKVSGTSLDNLTNHWVLSFSIKYSFFKINSSFSSKNQKSKHLLNCGWVIQKWVNFTCIFVSFVYIDLAWSVMVVYSKILSLLGISLAK